MKHNSNDESGSRSTFPSPKTSFLTSKVYITNLSWFLSFIFLWYKKKQIQLSEQQAAGPWDYFLRVSIYFCLSPPPLLVLSRHTAAGTLTEYLVATLNSCLYRPNNRRNVSTAGIRNWASNNGFVSVHFTS